MGKLLTIKDFIEKANKIHLNKYDYSSSNYINSRVKIKITCPIHGDFEQLPSQHLYGKGCLKCSSTRAKTIEEFIISANKIHKEKYNYTKSEYKNSHSKLIIICPTHGDFKISPTNHINGQGCKKCGLEKLSKIALKNSYGWSLSDWLTKVNEKNSNTPRLYLIKCFNENEIFIKIGITIRTIKKRFHAKSVLPYNYEVLLDLELKPKIVFTTEKLVLKNFTKYKPMIKFKGSGECLNIIDIESIINFICYKTL